ncbi:MAG: nitrile hydratase subunit beta [Proteobacteria bacterium]|nr:nitrile hydratase subunit beta [Pseudomonadota bacterium]
MDGVHDLGGKPGFGKVERTDDSKVFHERWEASVFTMVNAAAAAGAFANTDQFRHAIERIDPGAYLEDGYYGRWLGGIETLLVESGLLSQADIDTRAAEWVRRETIVSLPGLHRNRTRSRPPPQHPRPFVKSPQHRAFRLETG